MELHIKRIELHEIRKQTKIRPWRSKQKWSCWVDGSVSFQRGWNGHWSSRESNMWKLKKILPTRALCFLTPTQSTRESRFCFIMKNASRNHLLLLNTLMILGSKIHQYCLRILLRELWHVSGLSSLMMIILYDIHISYYIFWWWSSLIARLLLIFIAFLDTYQLDNEHSNSSFPFYFRISFL